MKAEIDRMDLPDTPLKDDTIISTRDLLQHILNNSVDVIITTDLSGKILFATPNVERLLLWNSLELEGHYIYEFYADHKESAKTIMKLLISQREIRDFEITLRRKDGEPLPITLSASLLINDEGRTIGTMGILRDSTEKKRLEDQLHHARKMEAIGTLAGGIAHDFNNVLMGIKGYISLMIFNMPTHHPHYDMLKSMDDQVESGAELTKKLLGFAMGGKYELKPVDMNDLVRKSAKIFGRTRKEIKINGFYTELLWSTEVDPGQIEHVLLNLYINAWQAMPDGGNLYLKTENFLIDEQFMKDLDVKPGPYVKVSVTDTGVGMDDETKSRIFEPFFTTKERGRGTGLGLASAYGIIKSHGGFINVYSEKGNGTTLTLYLPASIKSPVKEVLPVYPVKKGSELILLIDDEESMLNVIADMLKLMGYRVITANSGYEGLIMLKKYKKVISLVILDMIMPGMTGKEAFKSIKEIKSDVRVILSSGYSLNGQAREILHSGCHGFLQKPFSMTDLSEKIWEILHKPVETKTVLIGEQ